MATENNSDSAATGGLLVVLGIIVALAAAYFLFGMPKNGGDIKVEMPSIEAPAKTVNQ